jgi:hypothetical protein
VGVRYATPGAIALFLDDLREHPPALIIDMSSADQRHSRAATTSIVPEFAAYLDEGGWHKVARVAGARVLRPG